MQYSFLFLSIFSMQSLHGTETVVNKAVFHPINNAEIGIHSEHNQEFQSSTDHNKKIFCAACGALGISAYLILYPEEALITHILVSFMIGWLTINKFKRN